MTIKKILPVFISLLLSSPLSQADNIIRMDAPVQKGKVIDAGAWLPWESIVSEWKVSGEIANCSNWSPSPDTVSKGTSFTQTATDCQQPQQRTVQPTERNDKTLAVRNVGAPTVETRTIDATASRESLGTKDYKTAQYVVTIGQLDTQFGYMPNGNMGQLISSTSTEQVLDYASLGYGNRVLIGLKGMQPGSASLYESIKIDMVDNAGNIFYSIASNNIINDYPYPPYYAGWTHSSTDYENAKLAKRYIVTLNFK